MKSGKTVPFPTPPSDKLSPLGEDEEGAFFEEGKIGDLTYKTYDRGGVGVVHISDKNLKFKKDPDLFEKELNLLELDNLLEGEETIIRGSGDNDDLVFKNVSGDIKLSLRKKRFKAIEKLMDVVARCSASARRKAK